MVIICRPIIVQLAKSLVKNVQTQRLTVQVVQIQQINLLLHAVVDLVWVWILPHLCALIVLAIVIHVHQELFVQNAMMVII